MEPATFSSCAAVSNWELSVEGAGYYSKAYEFRLWRSLLKEIVGNQPEMTQLFDFGAISPWLSQ
jgi:hypothetical protein